MEEIKNNKKRGNGLILIIVVLSLLLIGAVGYICYDKFFADPKEQSIKNEKTEREDSNFYSVENLVKNKYIEKINNSFDQYIKIDNGKVYIFDYKEFEPNQYNESEDIDYIEAEGVEGTPKTVVSKFVQSIYNNMFLVLTEEGDLYYLSMDFSGDESEIEKTDVKFNKINQSKVLNIYDFYNITNSIVSYPYDSMTSYAELENGQLMEVSKKSQLIKTFEETWPYPDKICNYGVTPDGICGGLVISSMRILATEKYDENSEKYVYEPIKFENNEIKVKESFSVQKENTTNYYIISMEDDCYEIVQNLSDKSIVSVKKYKDARVKEFSFDIPNNMVEFEYAKAKITYVDGTSEEFNEVITVSTLYERYNK